MTLNDKTCNGTCGDGQICSQQTYNNGYCWNPFARNKALDRKADDYYNKQHTVGQKLGAGAAK